MCQRAKLGLLGGLMAASVFATGCLRTAQVYTIYPDGSGKADVKITLLGMMAQAAKMSQGQPGQESPLDQIKQSLQGKVYWKDLKAEDGPEGAYVMTGTAYFENIADVQPENGSIRFEPMGEGHKLTLNMQQELPGGMGGEGEMTPEQKAQAEQMKAMMKGMLAGFEMRISARMPGDVSEIQGFQTHEGRSATFSIGESDLMRMMDNNEKPPESMVSISGKPGDGLAAEWEAFKAELQAAKAAAQAEGQGGGEGGEGEGGNF